MKLYDITQEVFSGAVYPGDPAPSYERVLSIAQGEVCNLTAFTMCAHNATHMDAPYHFFDKGRTIEQIELFRCVGPCTVIELSKEYTREELLPILEKSQKRLLIKGESAVTPELARLFHEYQILLVGVEPQSVSSTDPVPVHHELLGKEVVLLEGLVLKEVEPGDYFLCAAPLKLGGSDGAPCRAFLIDFGAGEECLC